MNLKPIILAVPIMIALTTGVCLEASSRSTAGRPAQTISDKHTIDTSDRLRVQGNRKVRIVSAVTAVLAVAIVIYMRMALKGVAGQRHTVQSSRAATDEAVRSGITRWITAAVDSVHNAWQTVANAGYTDAASRLKKHEKDLRSLRATIIHIKFRSHPDIFSRIKTGVDAINDIAQFESNIRDLTIEVISSGQYIAEHGGEEQTVVEHLEIITSCIHKMNEEFSRHSESIHESSR